MADSRFDLFVILGADISRLTAGLKAAVSQVQQAGAQFQAAGAGMGAALNPLNTATTNATAGLTQVRQAGYALVSIGATMTATFGVAAAAIGTSVSAFSEFDAALTKSLAIQDNVTSSMRDRLATAALDLSKTISVSAKDSANAFYFLASAGQTVDQQIASLPIVTNFAKAGLVSVNEAAQILTRTQYALGLSSKDAAVNTSNLAMIADVLVKADTLALGRTQEFAAALTNKAATAMKTFGISLLDGISILAAYSQAGIRGAQAGTYFEMAVRNITNAAVKYSSAWKAAGIEVFDSQGKLRPIIGILADMQAKLGGMSDAARISELNLLHVQARAQYAIRPLLQMGETIADLRTKFEDFGGTSARVAQNQMQSFANQMDLLRNRVTALAIELGGPLAHALQNILAFLDPVFRSVEGLVAAFGQLPSGVQTAIAAIAILTTGAGLLVGGLVAAAGAVVLLGGQMALLFTGPVVVAALTSAFAVLTGPIGIATLAVVGLVAAFGLMYAASAKLNSQLDQTYTKFEQFGRANAAMVPFQFWHDTSTQVDSLNLSLIAAKAKLAEVKIQFDLGKASATDYSSAVMAVNEAYKKLDGAQAKLTGSAKDAGFQVQDFGIKLKVAGTAAEEVSGFESRLRDEIEGATAKVILAKQAYADHTGTLNDVAKAQAELSQLTGALSDKFKKLGDDGLGAAKRGAKEADQAAKELSDSYEKLGITSKKTGDFQTALGTLWSSMTGQALNQTSAVAVLDTAYQHGLLTFPAFISALQKVSGVQGAVANSTTQIVTALNPMSAATVEAENRFSAMATTMKGFVGPQLVNLGDIFKTTTADIAAIVFAYNDMKRSQDEEIAALPLLSDRLRTASLNFQLLQLGLAVNFPTAPIDDYTRRIAAATEGLKQLAAIDPSSPAVQRTQLYIQALTQLQAGLSNTSTQALQTAADITAVGASGITSATAFQYLGTKSQSELNAMADAATVAYQKIASSADAGTRAAADSFIAMVDIQRRAGWTIPPAMEAQYAQMKRATESTTKAIGESWIGVLGKIKDSIANDLSRAISDVIFQTGKIGDAFKRMGQDVVNIILDTIIKKGLAALLDSLASVQGVIGKIAVAFGGIAKNVPNLTTPGINGTQPPVGTNAPSPGAGSPPVQPPGGGLGSAAGGFGGQLAGNVIAAVGVGVQIASDVVTGYQLSHIGSDVNFIEKSTRYAWLTLGGAGNSIVSNTLTSMYHLADILTSVVEISNKLIDPVTTTLESIDLNIKRLISSVSSSGGSKTGGVGGTTISIAQLIIQALSSDPAALAQAFATQLQLMGVKV